MVHLPQVFCCLLALLLLSGCGGGGSSGGSGSRTPPPTAQPIPEPPPSYTLSGTVHIASNLNTDGDTNNPDSLQRNNNSPANAQPLQSPATLGGYVATVGAGDPGAVTEAGDVDDYFRVELLSGQTVTLLVAQFQQADADLYLFDSNGSLVDFSIESGQIETIVIPRNGIYFVNVFAFFGATNYVLAIGGNELAENTHRGAFKSDVIPWQAVIKPRRNAGDASYLSQRMGMRGTRGAGDRLALMRLNSTEVSTEQRQNRTGHAFDRAALIRDPALRARWETLMTVKNLRRDPDIELAEPNYRVRAMAIPNDQAYPSQWHFPLINLPAAWDITTGSPEVTVAVIDSGILSRHPDLAGQLVPGYDFIADASNAGDGNGIDPDPEDNGDDVQPGNSSFHGTHVSGTIAAASNNRIGVAGVAWQARIMPLRVLGADGGSSYDVDQAIRYAAGLANDSGTVPAKAADVINLSLGGAGFSQASQALINEVRARGVAVVAAAGNEARSAPGYPASYNGVISVSAVDAQRDLAPYSNFGADIDIAAPGGNNGIDITGDGYPDGILSTGGTVAGRSTNFTYTFLNGTSMASPHIAGVLALMKSVNPDLTPADIDALLQQGALTDDLGATGRDNRYGHGLVNARAAVVAALEASGNRPGDDPRLTASSAQLNFGTGLETLELVLRNSGKGELMLTSLKSSEPWLKVAAAEATSDGLGIYRVKVLREALESGLYRGQITAESKVNSVTVDVLVSVADALSGGDVGPVYLLLIDINSDTLVEQFIARADNGYQYRLENIPAGEYELVAGTDADNDLLICDQGEACGAFLTIDQPILLKPEADRAELDFPLEYQVNIPTSSGAAVTASGSSKTSTVRRRR